MPSVKHDSLAFVKDECWGLVGNSADPSLGGLVAVLSGFHAAKIWKQAAADLKATSYVTYRGTQNSERWFIDCQLDLSGPDWKVIMDSAGLKPKEEAGPGPIDPRRYRVTGRLVRVENQEGSTAADSPQLVHFHIISIEREVAGEGQKPLLFPFNSEMFRKLHALGQEIIETRKKDKERYYGKQKNSDERDGE